MKKIFYLCTAAALIALAGCAKENNGDTAERTAVESITARVASTPTATVNNRAINADDPTMSPLSDRAAQIFTVSIAGGTPVYYVYSATDNTWVPRVVPAYFKGYGESSIAMTLKSYTRPVQNGTAANLLANDDLTWAAASHVPASAITDIDMTHSRSLLEFDFGLVAATELAIGSEKGYKIPGTNKWLIIVDPNTSTFSVNINVGTSAYSSEITAASTPEGRINANTRYVIPVTLNGSKIEPGVIGVYEWSQGESGTATIDA